MPKIFDFQMADQDDQYDSEEGEQHRHTARGDVKKSDNIRNLVSFWFFGLTNNFAYSVMLSAAYDILKEESGSSKNSTDSAETTTVSPDNGTSPLIPGCNPIGTGAVLLADILPTLIVKLIAPFIMQYIPYAVRVGVTVLCCAASFPIVSTSHSVGISLLGVVVASTGSGLGEITFLAMSSHFTKNTVSTWSSGTGMAGFSAALSYLALTTVLSPRKTLFVLLFVPFVMAFCYTFILVKPDSMVYKTKCKSETEEETLITQEPSVSFGSTNPPLKKKITLLFPLLKFMIPLSIVYMAEYFINQALFELLFFEHAWLSLQAQYRWYQVLYQAGVLLSRSSVNCVHIKKIWILPILQLINVVILMLQVFFHYIPSIWIVFVIILWEGLLGGAAYVNTFYRISTEVTEQYREYSMGVTSVSDSLGITVAGFIAIPVHNYICTL